MSYLPWVAKGIKWANDVLDGTIPTGRLAKMAVERFHSDLEKAESDDWPYYFNAEKAEEWLGFLSKLKHVKGKRWAGKFFEPSGYQCFVTMNVYGWLRKQDDPPAFLEVTIYVPRKNGKSFWTGGLGLGHLTIDGEPGAEVYSGATSEKQAWEIFRPALQIVKRDDMAWLRFDYGIEWHAKDIQVPLDNSRFEPLVGNPGDGASPSFAAIDEVHEHKNDDLIETMLTGMAQREEPILWKISTAGFNFTGPGYKAWLEARGILEGSIESDRHFAILFTIDEATDDEPGDQWDTKEALIKANPNWEFLNQDLLLSQLDIARRDVSKQAAFKLSI